MAGVMRVRIACIAKKLVQFSFNNPNPFSRDKFACHFHRSAFWCADAQEVKMPSLSPTMSEGTIVKWLKKEGDSIAPGDVICDIETDKAVISFEMEEEGILAKIMVPEKSSNIKVGTLIALVVDPAEDWKTVKVSAASADSVGAGSGSDSVGAGSGSGQSDDSGKGPKSTVIPGATFHTATLKSYGPAVRNLLEKYDLKADALTPTGFRSKLLKDDVLKYIKSHNLTEKPIKSVSPPTKTAAASKPELPKPAKKPPVPSGFVDIEISSMRKVIANRLSESKRNIPHCYTTIVSDISKVVEHRMKLKANGVQVSINDFIIKAVSIALQQFPEVNAHWIQDQLVPVKNIDISIAVATDKGLITPIVHDVPAKGLKEIASKVKELSNRAREGKLQPQEFQGGSFTISNLGMFGVNEFTAIINPPQCAILAVGAGKATLNEDMTAATNMCATLSYNRAAFDDFIAAGFMKGFQTVLQNPSLMLLRST